MKVNKKEKVLELVNALNENLQERKEIIAICLLGVLCKQHIFLYGPPGTGKSLISRRLAEIFEDNKYFEYLMNRFSTPEEIFGPISLKELKNDNYLRKIEGYLPTSDFAFLDEIWKSSPAILNTLLTILNERVYKNGNKIEDVPLNSLVSASNEIPSNKDGLDALYDRFLIRINVEPTQQNEHFLNLINDRKNTSFKIKNDLKITKNDLLKWEQEIEEIILSESSKKIILSIKSRVIEKVENSYISDRRWKQATYLVKASAYFCDRKETNSSDLFVLSYCLWSEISEKKEIEKIIQEKISENPFSSENAEEYQSLIKRKKELSDELKNELEYSEYEYENMVEINGKKYFEIDLEVLTNGEYKLFTSDNNIDSDSKLYLDLDYSLQNSNVYHEILVKKNGQIESLGSIRLTKIRTVTRYISYCFIDQPSLKAIIES